MNFIACGRNRSPGREACFGGVDSYVLPGMKAKGLALSEIDRSAQSLGFDTGGNRPTQPVNSFCLYRNNTALTFRAEGATLLSKSFGGSTREWDAVRGETVLVLAGHDGRVWSAAFDSQKDRIATGGEDGSVILWDAVTGEVLFSPGMVPEGVFQLAFSADGRLLAASGLNGTVRVYVLPVDDLVSLAHQRLVREMALAECRQYLHLAACP